MLTNEVGEVIKKSFEELGTQLEVTSHIIKFLNSNSTKALKIKGVKDRTTMVMEAGNIFTKRNLLQIDENK